MPEKDALTGTELKTKGLDIVLFLQGGGNPTVLDPRRLSVKLSGDQAGLVASLLPRLLVLTRAGSNEIARCPVAPPDVWNN